MFGKFKPSEEVKIICKECGRTDVLDEKCPFCPDFEEETEPCPECDKYGPNCACEPEYYEDR